MKFVEFDDVFVATELNGIVGSVVKEIMPNYVANAGNRDGGCVGPLPTAEMMNLIVFRSIFTGSERRSISPGSNDAPSRSVIDVAADHAILAAIFDFDPLVSCVANRATNDLRAGSPH